jgi:tyrosyl-tRNA synthetase
MLFERDFVDKPCASVYHWGIILKALNTEKHNMTKLSIDEQVRLLMQGTDYGDPQIAERMAEVLHERLVECEKAGRVLRVYCGYDPTSTDLHLGHTITMRKLRQFQDLGHDVTFLIGSFTSLVGDPSDKEKARPRLTQEIIEANAQTYAEQAFKILDADKTRIRYNADWLAPLTFAELIEYASNFTVQQFLARDNFRKRHEKGEPIYLHEFFYALMQAYDAVAQESDVQVGGSDQLFNIIVAGRQLQKALGQPGQIGVILSILPGTDGVQRMSKSMGNHIGILDEPWDMYGKVMSIPDDAMPAYWQLVTRYSPDQIADIEQRLADGSLHPRDAKMELAREIVSIFHGDDAVGEAEGHFKQTIQQKGMPDDMPNHSLSGPAKLVDVLAELEMVSSKSDARRQIKQNAVRLDGEKVTDIDTVVELASGEGVVLQVGKRKFVRLEGA